MQAHNRVEHDAHHDDAHHDDRTVLRVVQDETSSDHAHEWAWTQSGRVPGVPGSRWMAYSCSCGAVERRSA